MFTNIEDAVNFVIKRRNNDFSFIHFKEVMNQLGNPQDQFYMIHVAGTDGKGSTVTFLRDLCMAYGYTVGTMQSPHYICHQDRIRVNNINIEDDCFISILNDYYDFIIENNLSMFEIDYIIAFAYFKQKKIDIAIIEVGLGGRLDSTNVVNHPFLSIITTIGYDHMDRLGNTLELICKEKCGIIKENSKTLIGKLNDSCRQIVIETCKNLHNEFYEIKDYIDLQDRKFSYENKTYELASDAKYQIHNASLALSAFDLICKDKGIVRKGERDYQAIKNSVWPCRFERVKSNPNVILDGAHNIHGVSALVESMDYLNGKKLVVFSALKRKEYIKMLELLKKHCDELIITTFSSNEVIDLNDFKDFKVMDDYKKAITYGIENYENTIVCGSLYFLSDVVLNYKF